MRRASPSRAPRIPSRRRTSGSKAPTTSSPGMTGKGMAFDLYATRVTPAGTVVDPRLPRQQRHGRRHDVGLLGQRGPCARRVRRHHGAGPAHLRHPYPDAGGHDPRRAGRVADRERRRLDRLGAGPGLRRDLRRDVRRAHRRDAHACSGSRLGVRRPGPARAQEAGLEPCTVTVDESRLAIAKFSPLFALTVAREGGGRRSPRSRPGSRAARPARRISSRARS